MSSGNFSVSFYQKKLLDKIRVSRGEQRLFIIEWEVDDKRFLNHYLLGNPPFDLERYKEWLKILMKEVNPI